MSSDAGSSSQTEGFVPDAKQAGELVNQFATITGTDTACAQFYLQDRDWDLQVTLLAKNCVLLFFLFKLTFY